MRAQTDNWAAVVAVRRKAAGFQRKESFFIIQEAITINPAVARKEIWNERSPRTNGFTRASRMAVDNNRTPPWTFLSSRRAKRARAEKSPARHTGGWAPVMKIKNKSAPKVRPAAHLRPNWRARKTMKKRPATKAVIIPETARIWIVPVRKKLWTMSSGKDALSPRRIPSSKAFSG